MKKIKGIPRRFIAIDFETATSVRNSACSVGLIIVEDSKIVDSYYTLIHPPGNIYDWRTIRVHGIEPEDTIDAPFFDEIYPKIKGLLKDSVVVAHNESFDRSVLQNTMEFYGLDYNELGLAEKWECTLVICRKLKIKPASLDNCSKQFEIELDHHNALSDASAAAQLYLKTKLKYDNIKK